MEERGPLGLKRFIDQDRLNEIARRVKETGGPNLNFGTFGAFLNQVTGATDVTEEEADLFYLYVTEATIATINKNR